MIEIKCDCGSIYIYNTVRPPAILICGCGAVLRNDNESKD